MKWSGKVAAGFLDGEVCYSRGTLVRLDGDLGVVTQMLGGDKSFVLWEDGFEDDTRAILGLKGVEQLPEDVGEAQRVLTAYLDAQEPGARWANLSTRRAVGAAYRALAKLLRATPSRDAADTLWREQIGAVWVAEVEAAVDRGLLDAEEGWTQDPGAYVFRRGDWKQQGDWKVYPDCETHADLPDERQLRTPVRWCWEGPRGVGASLTLEGALIAILHVERDDRVSELLCTTPT